MALDTPSIDGTERPSGPSAFALVTLVLMAILLPWAFGGVLRETRQGTVFVGLAAALLAFAAQARRGHVFLPSLPLWPLGGLLVLAVAQLVPLPPVLHGVIAPASHAVWHPPAAAAAAVMGTTWRPISVDPAGTRETLAVAGMWGLLCLLAAPALTARRPARRAALAVAICGAIVGTFGVGTHTAFGPLLYGFIDVPTINPYGPFVNKNHFAGYVSMTALLAAGISLGLAEEARRRTPDGDWRHGPKAGLVLTAGALALAGALAVFVSLSRGGGVGLFAGAVVFVLVHLRAARSRRGGEEHRRGIMALGIGAVVLVVGALLILPAESLERLQSITRGDASSSFRLTTWTGTLRMWAHNPLVGYGLGSFEFAFPPWKATLGELQVQHPENALLELLAEGGLAALLLAMAALRFLAGAAAAGSTQRGEPLRRGLVTGAGAGLTALIVQDLVDFNLHVPSNAALFAFLAALAAAGAGFRCARGLRPLAGVGMAIAACALAATAYATAPPSFDLWREGALRAASPLGHRALRRERTEEGLRDYLQGRPSDAQAWLLLGWTRLVAGDRGSANALFAHAAALDPANPWVAAQVRELTR